MEKNCVFLPQPIEEHALQVLKKEQVEILQAPDTGPHTISSLMKKADAVVLRTGVSITSQVLENAPRLLTVSRTGAGVDNVDLEAATKKGVIVTSSVGVNTVPVVEHTMAVMMCLFKQLFMMDRELRKGNFRVRYQNYPRNINKKTLGVVGFGKIGSLLGERCSHMGMKVLAYDPYIKKQQAEKYKQRVEFVDLKQLFKNADVVSIHIPLTENTRGLINMEVLKLMKQSAFLLNTSRGGIINEEDLAKALQEGVLAGAGLDVFENEPPGPQSPLLKLDNIVLTPHSAALTAECVVDMATSAVRRVLDVLHGYLPDNIANPEVLRSDKWRNLKKKTG
ncbi:MAG: hydroxyacid dehydrogenase [Spirochaetota bacterium]